MNRLKERWKKASASIDAKVLATVMVWCEGGIVSARLWGWMAVLGGDRWESASGDSSGDGT